MVEKEKVTVGISSSDVIACEKREPVPVAARSKAWTVLACSEAVIVGSNPTEGMGVKCVYVFILCLCFPVLR
jgi:hypothetical protein